MGMEMERTHTNEGAHTMTSYIVWDAENGTILAVDLTLTQARATRDALRTLGCPRVAKQAQGDREGGTVNRTDRGMATL